MEHVNAYTGRAGARAGVGLRHRCAISSELLRRTVALDTLRVKLAALSPECGVLHKTSRAQGGNDKKGLQLASVQLGSICGQYSAGKPCRPIR